MRPRAAFWSTTTLVVRGSFFPFAISDSRRSTRKMMSMARDLLRPDYRTVRAARRAWAAGPGSIAETSPPNVAISLTRLELT